MFTRERSLRQSHRRVLFLLKYRDSYSTDSYSGGGGQPYNSGLLTSALLVTRMLGMAGIVCALVQVTDNNDIDREVDRYQPTDVIIEGLWVLPSKFYELQRLHADVRWIVRIHSEIPFLALEGIAMEWLRGYLQRGVHVASNSQRCFEDLRRLFSTTALLHYLPNWYPIRDTPPVVPALGTDVFRGPLRVALLGAIRPLKNQLIQACAALDFARLQGVDLELHINSSRTEQNGESCLRNLRGLLPSGNPSHRLVEHDWLSGGSLRRLLSKMHVSLNVSFTETFNIVAADSVAAGCPIVTSSEVPWASRWSVADCTDAVSIRQAIGRVTGPGRRALAWHNSQRLRRHCSQSSELWIDTFGD